MSPHRTPLFLAGALVAFAALSAPDLARAAESNEKKDAAEKLFVEGREALAHGEQALACAKFRSSMALFPVPNAVANVARCAEREGRAVEALRAWEQVIGMLPDGDERLGPARERVAALAARVPRLVLGLPADLPADARILVDGTGLPRAAWSAPLPLAAGEHTVVVEALERQEQRFTITLTDGDRKELAVRAGPAPIAATATVPLRASMPPLGPPPAPPPAANGRRIAAFSIGGVGVAGLVVAGITGGMLLSRDARIGELCPQHACTPAGTQEIAGGKSLFVANAVAWGVGLAGVTTGAVLLLISRSHAPPGTTVAPLVTSRAAGLTFGGTF
jgi:hypothetical protein